MNWEEEDTCKERRFHIYGMEGGNLGRWGRNLFLWTGNVN